MVQCQFLPDIESNLRSMPQGERFGFLVRLVSAMIAGVALAGHDLHSSHPVRRCSKELVSLMQKLAGAPTEYPIEELRQLAETTGARIWRLTYFLSDDELTRKLESLVAPVFSPAPRLVGR